MDTRCLYEVLVRQFSLEELRLLAFQLQHDFDELKGEGKSARIADLITQMEQRGRLRELEQVTRALRPDIIWPSTTTHDAPYIGLRTFEERDAAYFFGRERLVEELVAQTGQSPFLVVLGSSGSGKSSVVLAGLVPVLKQGALPGSQHWRYAILKPGPRPLDTLAATLAEVQGSDVAQALALRQMLASNEQALLMLAEMLRAGSPTTRLVLVVDQFEELWTQAPTEPDARHAFAKEERLPFLRLLLAGTTLLPAEAQIRAPLMVILTMRADFLHRAAEFPDLARAIQEHDVIVSPMTHDELRRAIEQPARVAGVSFEPGLVTDLIKEVEGQPGALPLLEYALLELWKLREQDTLTRTAYHEVGGVEGALAARANAILTNRYDDTQRDDLRHLLLRLVQPGEGAADTRRRALLRDLTPAEADSTAVQELLQPLVEERLLTTGRDAATGEETVELSHEALLRAWPSFRHWVNEARDAIRLHLQLGAAARDWQLNAQDPDLLWGSGRLAAVDDWIVRARARLSAQESRFLQASQAHLDTRVAAQEQRRQEHEALLEARAIAERQARREAEGRVLAEQQARVESEARARAQQVARTEAEGRAQALTVARSEAEARTVAEQQARWEAEARVKAGRASIRRLLLLLFTAMLLAGMAWNRQQISASEARRSQSLALAGAALFEISRDEPDRAMRLALAAIPAGLDTYPSLISRAMRQTLSNSHSQRSLKGHNGGVNSVAWSPDGQQVLTGSGDGTARIWEINSGQLRTSLQGQGGEVLTMAWSPDGQQILTGSSDGMTRIWHASSGQLLTTLIGNGKEIQSVAWSPDGQHILTGSGDGTARIWHVSSGQLLTTLIGNGKEILSVAWSPDGQHALIGSGDGTARIWHASSGQLLTTLSGYNVEVFSMVWSPDGQQILTGSLYGSARIWHAASGQLRATLGGNHDFMGAVAWSPDGQQVLTSNLDGTVRIWSAFSGQLLTTLTGHSAQVLSAAWSPDGQQLLTGSFDDTARLWQASNEQSRTTLAEHSGEVLTVAWSPDGQRVITGSGDGIARIWQADSGQLLTTLTGHRNSVEAVAWSPDGQQVLTDSGDGTARFWQADNGQLLTTLAWPVEGVQSMAWSADGHQVLTGGFDGAAHVWEVPGGQLLTTLESHFGLIRAVAWSPDRQWILTGNNLGTAHIWQVNNGQLLVALEGHHGEVLSVAWSPNGQQVLTGSEDGAARVWQAANGKLLTTLAGHSGRVLSVTWNPDGQWILTGSDDRTARVWQSGSGQLLTILEGHSGEVSSVAWSPDGQQVLTGSSDGTARIWIASDRLIAAELIRRTCNLFTDEEIRVDAPMWQGNCASLLEIVKEDADTYERVRGQ